MDAALNELMTGLRPRLHRYCARMVGSAFEGEDVVQEALAKAMTAWNDSIVEPENWLFRIAHNTALDALRRRRRAAAFEAAEDTSQYADSGASADSRIAVTASLAVLQTLSPLERSCVVLVDVLGYAAAETAAILDISVAAVKAALHRGRARLALHSREPDRQRPLSAEERLRLRSYADKFNARDFDALRDLLADDVRLDLVNRVRLEGKKDVSTYFVRYSQSSDWFFALGWAEDRPVLLVSAPADRDKIRYVVVLDWKEGRIVVIRDFRYAPYIVESLEPTPL